MAKKFKNGVTLLKYVSENVKTITTDDIASALNELSLSLLRGAMKQAEKNLDVQSAFLLKDTATKYGGFKVDPKTSKKKWETKLSIKIGSKVPEGIKNLILGHCNKVGGCLMANELDTEFTYGFKKVDASNIVSKMGSQSLPDVTITTVK